MKKLILPIKYVASILIGIASLGLLIYYIVSFANAFELIKNDWSYIVDYICYFLIFAATAFGAGRGVYLLAKGNNEKFENSIREAIYAYLLFGLWICIDSFSLYAKNQSITQFPVLPLIVGIFSIITFVALLLRDVKKLSDKKHIFNMIYVAGAVISGVLFVVVNAFDAVMIIFLVIGLLALIGFAFVDVYNTFFVKKEEPAAVEGKVEE
jgi:hypothetical protein